MSPAEAAGPRKGVTERQKGVLARTRTVGTKAGLLHRSCATSANPPRPPTAQLHTTNTDGEKARACNIKALCSLSGPQASVYTGPILRDPALERPGQSPGSWALKGARPSEAPSMEDAFEWQNAGKRKKN